MKTVLLSILLLSFLLYFGGCAKEQPKASEPKNNDAFRTLNSQNDTRSSDNVVCHNCRATFKLTQARKKSDHGHDYIECPICHHDYLKKAE